MTLSQSVASILADVSLDTEADARDSSRVEELEKLVPQFGWQSVEAEMFRVLLAPDDNGSWNVAAGVFWNAALERRALQSNRLIACLYLRFPQGDNLAWSITSKLKGVGYVSDYDPSTDPDVQRELAVLQDCTT